MVALDLKTLVGLIKSAGPTQEHQKAFGRTFVGSLVGQATFFVLMMLIYVAAIVLLQKYAFDDLKALYTSIDVYAFWSILLMPFIFILLFSLLPTTWQALRERRLEALIIGGDLQFKPGYFRLYPYGAADRDTFRRLDDAESAVAGWLNSAKASVLYFSGASGVGKSSLLAANVLPQLRDDGWRVIETRLFGDPTEHLREAILSADNRHTKVSTAKLPLRNLFERIMDARRKGRGAHMLLVIDQFEEFLILRSEQEHRSFAEFVSDLTKRPIEGLKILLVFRSDYRPLVFKLELPTPIMGLNWQELAPYDRGQATTFLQSGGRQLSSEAIDKLFRGLDRIEDAPGMYRPITLNMIGMVLERMGRQFEGDPGRLIQSYLTTCIMTGDSRDFAKPLLTQLITDVGTKDPRSEKDLTKLTGFEVWQVRATLADLARLGLVRGLEGTTLVWEVAHDFLARIIGQLIGRLRPSTWQRARPLIAPLMLIGWLALAVFALPYWTTMRQRIAEEELRGLGASLSGSESHGITVAFSGELMNEILVKAAPHIATLRATGVALYHFRNTDRSNLTSLDPLKNVKSLRALSVVDFPNITGLEPVRDLPNLQVISVSMVNIKSLEPVSGLHDLTKLTLDTDPYITSLEPLKDLSKLTTLVLSNDTG
jgi:hypothetical protein